MCNPIPQHFASARGKQYWRPVRSRLRNPTGLGLKSPHVLMKSFTPQNMTLFWGSSTETSTPDREEGVFFFHFFSSPLSTAVSLLLVFLSLPSFRSFSFLSFFFVFLFFTTSARGFGVSVPHIKPSQLQGSVDFTTISIFEYF